ncbi:hypothetical protein CDL12_18642 [Handroanthus impetiginosus]|uniref:Putative plant transposon protein domain-containing protein n=1 Tax=Handroanthus impetiginosus TaxID=429701 RepID=A0A2G9GU25_9LAMI|nr:hypothetical protein CDL12_18642 [Handroanthus impetiginosus]
MSGRRSTKRRKTDVASTSQGHDQRRFISQEAEDYYDGRLLDRAMFRERGIQDVDDIVERHHWEDFIADPGWTLSRLNEPIHFSRTKLTVVADNWLRFISARILPTKHTSKVTRERAVMIFAILTDVPFDIGRFLHKSIWKSAMAGLTVGLYHSSLITELCARAGLERQLDDELLKPDSMIRADRRPWWALWADQVHIPMSNCPHYPPDKLAERPPTDMGDE